MAIPSSFLHISRLIQGPDLAQLDALITMISFEDGRATASGAAREVKSNLQSVRGENNPHLRQAEQLILNAMAGQPLLHAAAMPKMILPVTISRYQPGMEYGWHTDSPLMTNVGTIRVDLSMTLFLSDPETYTGGELVIHTPTGLVSFKPAKGDAVIYPTTRLHRVNPVTQGERVAAVTWMQSVIRDTEKRELVFQTKTLLDSLEAQLKNTDEHLLLQQIYSNLVRMWADI